MPRERARRTNKYGTSAKERGEIFLFSRQRMGGQEEGFRGIHDEKEREPSPGISPAYLQIHKSA